MLWCFMKAPKDQEENLIQSLTWFRFFVLSAPLCSSEFLHK